MTDTQPIETWGPGTPQRLTPEEKRAGIERILAERPEDGPFRLFAFGSLMWNPECHVAAKVPATVHDFERRFQIWSTRARGCVGARLDTYSFQARGFYERLGYTVTGAIEDCPPGHTRWSMAKRLDRG